MGKCRSRDFGNTSTVKVGTKSIKISFTSTYGALSLRKGTTFPTNNLTEIKFWIYCSTAQTFTVKTQNADSEGESTGVSITTQANACKEITVTRAQLGNPTSIKRFNVEVGGYTGDVYFDEIRFFSSSSPARVEMEIENTDKEMLVYPNPKKWRNKRTTQRL